LESTLKLLVASLVLTGVGLLVYSLSDRKYLCSRQENRAIGWCVLFSLIGFFILGYLFFLWEVFRAPVLETYHVLASVIFSTGGFFVFLVVKMSRKTVSDVVKIAEQDRHNALHDSLTGLPNRALLYERIDQAILHAKREITSAAVVLLDLDRFKEVNDTLGHAVGDKLLKEIAPRLSACIREVDTISRIGGDEFAAVLPGANEKEAVKIASKIAKLIDQSFLVDEHSLNIGVSIGVAVYPYHGLDTESLIQHADIAMYRAKRNEQEYVIYDVKDNEYSVNRLELVSKLREAVRSKNFYLVYQPKMDINTLEIVAVEALLRWNDSDLGEVPPDEFIPVIERLGLMKELTLWVMTEALNQHKKWQQRGVNIKVAINLSANNLSDSNFPAELQQIIDETQNQASDLLLEITESNIMINPDHAAKLLTEVADMGIHLSIDDFGTGYSSLAYLKNLPASEVKIDKSFVMDILKDESDAVIVYATISLVHSLGYKIVAEGVENQDILDVIGLWGCDIAQGYHVSKPLMFDEVYDFIVLHNSKNNIHQFSNFKPASSMH